MWLRLNVNSYPGIQPWFHYILHSTEFTHEFMIINSYMISLSWIHLHKFRDEFIHIDFTEFSLYSSLSWIHIWIHIMNSYKISWSFIDMWHFMTCEIIYEFMYMKNILKSYLKIRLKSCVPRFQMESDFILYVTHSSLSGRWGCVYYIKICCLTLRHLSCCVKNLCIN